MKINNILAAALLFAMPFYCQAGTASDGMQIMQAMIDQFATNSARWVSVMQGAAWKLFGALAIFEIFIQMKKHILDENLGFGAVVGTLVKLVMVWCLFGWMISDPDYVLGNIIKGFIKLGGDASGLGELNPSQMVATGIDIAGKISQNLSRVTAITNPVIGITASLTMILIVLAFCVLGLQMFAALLHYYLLLACAPILLAGGAFSMTRDWAVKQVQGAVSTGVSILVVYLISGVVVSYIPQFQAAIDNGGVTNITPLLVMCAASILIFFLAWKAPTIASSIMSGTTSVNTSDMASFGMTMVAAGAASAAGGLAAAQGAATGGMAAARGAVKGYDFAKGLMGGGAGSISEAGGGGMTQDSLGGMPGGGAGSNGKLSAADSARQNLALLGGAPSGMVLDPGFDNSDFGSDSGAGDASSASIGGQGNSGSGSAPKDEDKKPSLVSRAKSIAQSTQQQANMVKDWIPDAQNGGTLHIDHKE